MDSESDENNENNRYNRFNGYDVHNRYEYGWGGFTEIITKPNPILIHPIPNRLLIFPGTNSHKAYSFAYQTCPLRVTLAFKIHSIDTDNKL